MATIVKMPAPRARTADTAALPGGATILFFTGVRYVRDDEDEAVDVEAPTAAVISHAIEDTGVHAAV